MDISKGKAEDLCMVTTTHMRSASQRKYQNHIVNRKKIPRPNIRNDPKVFTRLRESKLNYMKG